MDGLIWTAPALWAEIKKTAQLKHREYDLDLLQSIRTRLGLPADGSMAALLRQYEITCESLLDAVLQCMMPFSIMLNDLYGMFQKAGAQQTNYNIKIQFDFDRSHTLNSIDLTFFRQQVALANDLVVGTSVGIPSHPYGLVNQIREIWTPNYMNDPVALYPKEIKNWLEDYKKCPKGTWPDNAPPQPFSGHAELDAQLEALWQILNASLWKYRNRVPTDKRPGSGDSRYTQFWQDETDCWLGAFVRSICNLLTRFRVSPESEHGEIASFFARELERCLAQCDMIQVEMEKKLQSVIDILNLPFWKKRYELYSVWVSTQILQAFPEEDVHFHVEDNTLRFSFGGSHIATFNSYNPPLELWAEVRTYFDSPRSPSRKRHIQPDYTLAVGDAFHANNSVAVVECKQYKKYSRRNFLYAAEDYAGGRPNSNVFLVNYGPIPVALKDEASAEFRDRIHFYEKMRPLGRGNPAFTKELRHIIDQYYKTTYGVARPKFSLHEKPHVIRLVWPEYPKDLDLHLMIETEQEKYHVFYGSMGSARTAPFVSMGADDREGGGDETIRIKEWIDGRYDIYVHDFLNENQISGAITVTVECGGQVLYAVSRVEPLEKGTCWHPFSIQNGKLILVDELTEEAVLANDR